MKKRILALALCLVMAVSLLPITAAAATDYKINSANITSDGWSVGNLPSIGSVYQLYITDWELVCDDATIKKGAQFFNAFSLISHDKDSTSLLTSSPEAGVTYYVRVMINCTLNEDDNTYSVSDSNFGADLTITGVTGFKATFVSAKTLYNQFGDGVGIDMLFTMIKEDVHEHDWSYEVSKAGDSLTATCGNSGCDIGEVTVKLNAHSVTLPDSPFNAQLAGKEQFKAAFPNAVISDIRYDYKGSDGVWHKDVANDPANAKAGEYQAFVEISNLPGPVVDESGNTLSQNGEGYLYVKYTAADPKVTAQTGDNRPIEIMMASLMVFSALAAAAFVLDSKRKYSR